MTLISTAGDMCNFIISCCFLFKTTVTRLLQHHLVYLFISLSTLNPITHCPLLYDLIMFITFQLQDEYLSLVHTSTPDNNWVSTKLQFWGALVTGAKSCQWGSLLLSGMRGGISPSPWWTSNSTQGNGRCLLEIIIIWGTFWNLCCNFFQHKWLS